jgi:hypothetical protein
MVDIIKHGLTDDNQKVKTITALTVSALAEAASPYGIESFDDVLEPLWKGIRLLRGKVCLPTPHIRLAQSYFSCPAVQLFLMSLACFRKYRAKGLMRGAFGIFCRCWRRS